MIAKYVITKLQGGMGNQMFQYASALGIAQKRGLECLLDNSWYDTRGRGTEFDGFERPLKLNSFRITCRTATPAEIAMVQKPLANKPAVKRILVKVYRKLTNRRPVRFEPISKNFDEELIKGRGAVYMDGFWQSEKYFSCCLERIREEFQFKDDSIDLGARKFVAARKEGDIQVISVHVRRGDIAYASEVLGRPELVQSDPLPEKYFNNAMKSFGDRVKFLVFSDAEADLEWCRRNLVFDSQCVEFLSGQDALQDFAIMKHCDHNIISNSTFSWWAAWLNPSKAKRVIAPREWFRPGFAPNHRIEDLIPTGWVLA